MRLFIATTFPADVLRELNDRIAPIKAKLKASWVRAESQHLTFAFLGEQEESVVERIQIHPDKTFDGHFENCGFFPNRRQPRVAWVGVEPRDRFVAIGQRVRDALRSAKIAFDDKPFKPHLTLARIRDRWLASDIALFEEALRDYRSATFPVASVTLFSSRLNPNGAIHTPLRTFGLTA